MAPGIYTYDQLDMMGVSSNYFPSFMKLSWSSSSLSPPSLPLSFIHCDHDYVLKPVVEKVETEMDTAERGVACQGEKTNSDTMLSSCALEVDTTAADEMDETDLLHELDDLDFTLADLDPCSDMAMEDSFQEFIDSALSQSYPSFQDDDTSEDQQQSEGQDTVILNKEDFLKMLHLRPARENQNTTDSLVPSASSLLPQSLGSSLSSSGNAASASTSKDSCSMDVIPTKKCSCSASDHVTRMVYSTPRSPPVQTSASTTGPGSNVNANRCTNCVQNIAVPADLMSPLYIDTSSYGFQPLSDECLAILMDEDMPPSKVDDDVTDLLEWLNENQQDQEHNGSAKGTSDDASIFAETPSQGSVKSEPLDLESFIDLKDFVTADATQADRSDGQHESPRSDLTEFSSWSSHDHTYQRNVESLKTEQKDRADLSHQSLLKFSFLTEVCEQLRDSGKHRCGSDSFMIPTEAWSREQSPKSLDLLPSGYPDDMLATFSPRPWPASDLTPSVPPSPLSSTDLSLYSHSDDSMESSDVKGHLALLDLFSDENAPSLLQVDSAVSSIRYM